MCILICVHTVYGVRICLCMWRVNVTTDSDVLTSLLYKICKPVCFHCVCVRVCVHACIWHTSLHLCMCVYYLCMDLNWLEKSQHALFPWAAPGCCFSVGVHTSVPALWCQNPTHAISGLLPLVSQSCLCCKTCSLGTLPPAHNTSPGKTALASISERIKYKVTCIYVFQCYKWFWSCLPFWTAKCLHSVLYTVLFFWHPHAENPAIQRQDSWLLCFLLLWTPHLEFTPTRP